jgi:hypothetical protein
VEIRLLTRDDAEAFRALRLSALKECPTAFTADYETNLQHRLRPKPPRRISPWWAAL